jgi:predicted regulator of Ras-like GTPase activity (Roadblock/LC7/MglB family)
MSFESILGQVLNECPGALGVALMGSDGIPIAQVAVSAPRDLGDEVSLLGIEFGRILDEARKAASAAGAGGVLELAVQTERCHVLIHPLDRETYLVLAVASEGNAGKGRYLMRRHRLALREEL